LTQGSAEGKFRVLVYHEADVDVLAEIVRNDKRLSALTFLEHIFEVDSLGASRNFLQLLSSEFHLAVFDLGLADWLRLVLALDGPVSIVSLTFLPDTIQVKRRLILVNGTLNVKRVHLTNKVLKLRRSHLVVNAKIHVFLDFFQSYRRTSFGLLKLLLNALVDLPVDALVFNVVVETFFV
jgi:hypothetical protein